MRTTTSFGAVILALACLATSMPVNLQTRQDVDPNYTPGWTDPVLDPNQGDFTSSFSDPGLVIDGGSGVMQHGAPQGQQGPQITNDTGDGGTASSGSGQGVMQTGPGNVGSAPPSTNGGGPSDPAYNYGDGENSGDGSPGNVNGPPVGNPFNSGSSCRFIGGHVVCPHYDGP